MYVEAQEDRVEAGGQGQVLDNLPTLPPSKTRPLAMSTKIEHICSVQSQEDYFFAKYY